MVDNHKAESEISEGTAREVVRLSELYIDGTLRLSLAADTRALQITNMLAGASTVLLGVGLVTLLDPAATHVRIALGSASLCCGTMFLVGLFFSSRTIRPREFNIGGTLLRNWAKDELTGSLAPALMGQAKVYEKQALENIETLSTNAQHIRKALGVFGVAIPLSAVVGGITYAALVLCR